LLHTHIETVNTRKYRFRPYLSGVIIRLLADLDYKPHEMVFKNQYKPHLNMDYLSLQDTFVYTFRV